MKKTEVIQKLINDEDYYGEFGKQYLSNSDIKTLLNNPLELKKPSKQIPAFLVGGYFHTAILEPDKLKNFKIIESTTRNTKAYKEISQGEMCLLQHEVDQCEVLVEKIMDNRVCRDLIHGDDVEFERPEITELFGNKWKGKADIVNHSEKLVIDLKTTAELDKFHWSAKKYNYDSQAYIYRELFGYEFIFIAIDKKTGQIGLFDCSTDFYKSGMNKVEKASEAYDLFYKTEGFDPSQYFINKTL
jgi:hypothetical protein|tara:strand:+ start:2270 stop:3001 length:732 start_codon:yes stop_codon:yes gene_type:complete